MQSAMRYSIRHLFMLMTYVVGGMVLYAAFIRSTSTAPTREVLGNDGYEYAWLHIYIGGAVMGGMTCGMTYLLDRVRKRRKRPNDS